AMGRKVKNCDFGFLVAGAYSGFVIWGSGLSSSIALVSATEGSEMNFIARHTDIVAVPLSQTLGSPMNLALVAGTLVLMPLMFRLMMPRGAQIRAVDPALLAETEEQAAPLPAQPTPAERLEHSRVLLYVLAGFGVVYLVRHFWTRGFALDLNVIILLFLVLGMILHGRPVSYLRAFNQAARVAGPLALQYPLYGGIMGIMAKSGLAGELSQFVAATSNETVFPWLCFLSATVLNIFIPSGGGQWAVQGPFVIPAALELGVSPAVTAMAVAFGDQTTNMLQPFWALPVLAIARLKIRDIMGYCVMTCLLSFALTTLVLFLLV
ncbi:MAG TPA: TIGR00366 family protein, partial [Candidatus Acidoferrales bacterium]